MDLIARRYRSPWLVSIPFLLMTFSHATLASIDGRKIRDTVLGERLATSASSPTVLAENLPKNFVKSDITDDALCFGVGR